MRNLLLLPLLATLLGAPPVVAQPTKPAAAQAPAQNTTKSWVVSGLVRDQASHQPLPGVTVLVKGTNLGAATDAQGRYSLLVPNAARAVLLFNVIGYLPIEKPVGTHHTLDVALAADTRQLEEVTVTAKGIEPKRAAVSYSVATVTAAPAQADKKVKSKDGLRGRVAGVQLADYSANQSTARPLLNTPYPARDEAGAGDTYAYVQENAFFSAKKDPLSTFSLDVDNASYSNVRRFLNEGQLPPRDAVRVEEMLNYFRYEYPAPPAASPDPVRLSTELAVCPWNPAHQLARIGIQARKVETAKLPPANLVFLVDVSGSMYGPDRLPLVQAGLKLLVKQLRPQDHVALVVYAGAAGLVLPPTPGSQPQVILDAIDRLQAGGSTAGGAGLRLAYSTARQSFNKEGNNRVILATDGDFNVGESSDAAMEQLIVEQRESGVFLTVLGCGRGNLRDARMETLADKGNGNYAYLDNLDEAGRVLVAQFGGTLFTVAKDVKLQIEFNPARVANYRLVGYENRLLAAEDFNNDRKDAGELGAGHTVTALYELVPVGASQPLIDDLKYQPTKATPATMQQFLTNDVLTVKLRYKEPQGSTSKLLAQPLVGAPVAIEKASADFRFAAAVAQFGMLLRQSEQRGTATWAATEQLANNARGTDADGYRAELVRLVRLAEGLSGSGAVGKR
ncbi:YfbK domain-containing protein [Hymenobacter ruricola]|uniref:von Willebrand factor type A domain-containing protein n=1 Tax=Hymenobacter ruricola TaxID=2791023 RepID=A0ABS0IAF4_9BACT|nr:von Willebrand factor type A domain-containing protein [Hymenobacter ruricola]MBF9223894.1 von Willebrand factor type A domain-containing protein [Hymenobacter ruricola]